MKYSVGDKLNIGGTIEITGVSISKKGVCKYQTNPNGTFQESALDKLVCKTASVKPQDKPVFPWDDFKVGKIAVHCDTEEKAKAFIAECKRRFPHECRLWAGDENNWNHYRSETTYIISYGDLMYGDVPFHKSHRTPIIDYPFSPAEPKQDAPIKLYCVKTGGVIHNDEMKRGEIYTFSQDKRTLINENGKELWGTSNSWEEWKSGNPKRFSLLVPLVSRPAKAGEWITPIKDSDFRDGPNGELRYKKGDLLLCTRLPSSSPWSDKAVIYNNTVEIIRHGDYLVLDGYDGRYELKEEIKQEPKYYSGKVVCVDTSGDYTVGKVYEFKDGKVTDNEGDNRPMTNDCVRTLAEWNKFYGPSARFIEYKGEAT